MPGDGPTDNCRLHLLAAAAQRGSEGAGHPNRPSTTRRAHPLRRILGLSLRLVTDVDDLDDLLERLERLVDALGEADPDGAGRAYELLDGIDTLHRFALRRLELALGPERVRALRAQDLAVAWLFDAYGVGVDERAAVEVALASARPYIESHGGSVEVAEAVDGVVRIRMGGTCAGCTASAQTLTNEIERSLREGFAGFVRIECEDDDTPPHPPPNVTPVELGRRP